MRPIRRESFDILPASQRVSEGLWYQGTADAVYQNLDIIEGYDPKYLVVLAGDHSTKWITSRCSGSMRSRMPTLRLAASVPRAEASGFGVMDADEDDVIRSFVEKPGILRRCPESPTLRSPAWASMSSRRNSCWASCGVTPLTPTRPTTLARISFPISSRTGRRSHIAFSVPASGRSGKKGLIGAMSEPSMPIGQRISI